MKYNYHKDGSQPNANEVFVFGSNLAGRHGAGAARHAFVNFGAELGVGEGFTGECYALPTCDENICPMTLDEIRTRVDRFIERAKTVVDITGAPLNYFITRVGCVIAGHSDEDIATMFIGAPENCNFPENWKEYLE